VAAVPAHGQIALAATVRRSCSIVDRQISGVEASVTSSARHVRRGEPARLGDDLDQVAALGNGRTRPGSPVPSLATPAVTWRSGNKLTTS
jgi:hypothetical protein